MKKPSDKFGEGYSTFSKLVGSSVAGSAGESYIAGINNEITALSDALNSYEGYQTHIEQLKGNAAEHWHAQTHNINAAVEGGAARATVPESNAFGSVDVTTSEGSEYGLKYYKDAQSTAKSQSISYEEAYNAHAAKITRSGGEPESFEEFIENRTKSTEASLKDPVYSGQARLVPSDQLPGIKEVLEKRLAKDIENRPEEAERLRETLSQITDRIESSDGTSSIELSEKEAKELARLAKEGEFNPEDYGLSTEELVQVDHIAEQALRAGLTAAAITMAIKIAPEIYKCIDLLIRTGHLDIEDFKKVGLAGLSGASEGFLRGSISAAIVSAGHAGLIGESMKNVQPEVVGALTVLLVDTMKNAYLVSTGSMSASEMSNNVLRTTFVTSGALALGMAGSSVVPVFGYLAGSFVGSFAGTFAYSMTQQAYIALAIDNGFTYFGLVDQNYEIPNEILDELGLDLFEHIKFDARYYDTFSFDEATFNPDQFEAETISITAVKRGVFDVNRIGYTVASS